VREDGSSVCEMRVYNVRHPMSAESWDTGVMNVITREKQTAALAVGKNAQNSGVAD
jgi:hypothetical protein